MIIEFSSFNSIIENIVRNSIEDNFEKEGRWGDGIFGGGKTRWEKSYRAIKQSGKTLQDTGQLAASIQVKATATGSLSINSNGDKLEISNLGGIQVEVGSNKKVSDGTPLAAIHHYGGSWSVPKTEKSEKFFWAMFYKTHDSMWRAMALSQKKAFKIVMPRRPILVLQNKDTEIIRDKFMNWLNKYVS